MKAAVSSRRSQRPRWIVMSIALSLMSALVVGAPAAGTPATLGSLIERVDAPDDPWRMVEGGESLMLLASESQVRAIEPAHGQTVWTADFAGLGIVVDLRTDASGAVAVLVESGGGAEVFVLAEPNGVEIGSFSLDAEAELLLGFGDGLVVSARRQASLTTVVARRFSGEHHWDRTVDGSVRALSVLGNSVFVGGSTTGEPFAANPDGDTQGWWAELSSADGSVGNGHQIADRFAVVGIEAVGNQVLLGLVGVDDQRWSLRTPGGAVSWEGTIGTADFACPCGAEQLADGSVWLVGQEYEGLHDGFIFDPAGDADYHPGSASDLAQTPHGGHLVVEPLSGSWSRWTSIPPAGIAGIVLQPRHEALRVSWEPVQTDAVTYQVLGSDGSSCWTQYTSCALTGLDPTMELSVTVIARNVAGTVLSAAVVETPGQPCGAAQPFLDVAPTSFAASHVACLAQYGITTGTSPTTFDPDVNVTREQTAAFIARTMRLATTDICSDVSSHPFTDVSAASFADDDVACLAAREITTGTSPTTFAPLEAVTRAQMATFIGRTLQLFDVWCPADLEMPFGDVASTSFAFTHVACLYHHGVTTGTSATTFDPSAVVTREQMAAFIGRAWLLIAATVP